MRLLSLGVAAFGALRPGLRLEFGPGLNLLLAPNEAGKTTTLELITALWYGFGRRVGGAHPFEPWAGGSVELGGELAYEMADGRRYTLSRHLLKRGESLKLEDQAGGQVELNGREPGQAHLGMSKGVFHTVSRVALDDLQKAFSGASPKEYGAARQELLGYFFLEAATRGQVANPVQVREEWENRAGALYHADKRRGKADRDLMGQQENAESQLAQARQREEAARRAQGELEELAERLSELGRQRQEAGQEAQGARAALERARELERQAALQAEIARLAGQGLADEASENRARDLEREIAAAGQRAGRAKNQAAEARAAAGQGDPAQSEAGLNKLHERWVAWQTRAQEADAQEKRLDGKRKELEEAWAMEAASLAALEADLPYRLHDLTQAMNQAGEEARQAGRALAALPAPPPGWALPLGLGLLALVGGVKGLIWSYLAAWPWWVWLASGLALAAGLALGVWSLGNRRRAGKRAAEEARLGGLAQEAASRAESLRAQRDAAAAGLSPAAAQAEPARLAAARAEAVNLMEQRLSQDQAQEGLAGERAALERETAELTGRPEDRDWSRALQAAREALKAQARALAEAQRLEREAEQAGVEAQARRQELERHLSGAGLADMEALRQARSRSRRVNELNAKLAEVDERLTAMPDRPEAPKDAAACQKLLEEAEGRLKAMQSQFSGLDQRRGSLAQELKQLNQSQSAAQAEAALEELRRQRHELARRQGALLLAGACLERAMRRFRLEAQPSLLQKASAWLQKASAGAYEWLGSDIFEQKAGQDPSLNARPGPAAREREAEALSRGTRDQLYLSLRLALAQEITSGGEPVPLLLDDPLVNFDDRRLAAALAMLAGLAGERQVLLFTCHRAQYEILKGAGDCRLLELA
ncbi:hypothetical protein AAU61_08575 [Desulfocarbo indianensis]|nr:hypothetical protein AAU61_08575 [Desulfocarbo indianensis]